MLRKPVRFGLIGFGGYGRNHCKALDALAKEGLACLAAVSETNQAAWADQLRDYAAKGVAVHTDWKAMLSQGNIDAVAIAAPLHLHREMVTTALEQGFPVLCEKSAATTVQEVQAMVDAAARTRLLCGVDFQMLSSDAVSRLKILLAQGVVGTVKRISGIGLWKRTDAYYQRTPWAGKFQVGNRYVLDGPMNNALAHMLNNMLYIAAPEPGRLATPEKVRAEMYRAQPLPEMEDIATVQINTKENVEILFLATYDHTGSLPHYYRIDGTNGTVVVENGKVIVNSNGMAEVYAENALNGSTTAVYRNFIASLDGKETLLSSIAESLKLVRVQNGAYLSSGRIHSINPDFVSRYEDTDGMATAMKDIKDVFAKCLAHNGLPSDVGAPWAVATEPVDVTDLAIYAPESPDNMVQQEAS